MKIAQKIAIKKKNKFLILLRSRLEHPKPLHWDFPGGRLEDNEDPIAGIKREVKEETCCEVGNLKIDQEFFPVYAVSYVIARDNLLFNIYGNTVIGGYEWFSENEDLLEYSMKTFKFID